MRPKPLIPTRTGMIGCPPGRRDGESGEGRDVLPPGTLTLTADRAERHGAAVHGALASLPQLNADAPRNALPVGHEPAGEERRRPDGARVGERGLVLRARPDDRRDGVVGQALALGAVIDVADAGEAAALW